METLRDAELSLDLLFKINALVRSDTYNELGGYDQFRRSCR